MSRRIENQVEDGSRRRKVGAVVSYLYTIASIVVSLVYVPLLLGGIGQEEFGLYQLVGSVMSYVVSINSILASGVSRYYCMYLSEGDFEMAENTLAISKRLYWVLSAVSMVVVFILIFVVRAVYQSAFTALQLDECSAMLVVLGINTVVTMNNTINIAAITANERFVFLKGSQLITLIVQPILVIILTRVMPNALMVTLVILGMNALCAAAQRVYAQGFLKVSYAYHGWDRKLVRGLVGFSGSIVLVVAADQIFWKADQLIIGYLSGAAMVAVYAIGSQIYTAYRQVGSAVSSVFFPRVSELFHGEHDLKKISELYAKVGRITFLVCGIILGAFLILGPDFISLWAGDAYAEAYWVAALVMVSLTVDLAQTLSNTIMQVTDKYLFRGLMLLTLAVINLGMTVLLVQLTGIAGAALSTAVCMLIGCFLINWYLDARIGLDVRFFWHEVGSLLPTFLILTVAFGLAYWFLPIAHANWTTFIVGGALYLAMFFGVFWRFCLNDYEKGLVKGLLRRAH